MANCSSVFVSCVLVERLDDEIGSTLFEGVFEDVLFPGRRHAITLALGSSVRISRKA